uniref:hypothetical protein n=1 Tax=Microbacterium sp. B19 TaxID=96765 RepID=UPI000561EB48
TVWAVSSGSGIHADESVLVVTHSDGGNAVEENGFIGLLELARDAAETPHDRTIVFVLVAGHLRIPAVTAHGQATTAWLHAHPEWWSPAADGRTAVAGLVIEHLGAKHRRDDDPSDRSAMCPQDGGRLRSSRMPSGPIRWGSSTRLAPRL